MLFNAFLEMKYWFWIVRRAARVIKATRWVTVFEPFTSQYQNVSSGNICRVWRCVWLCRGTRETVALLGRRVTLYGGFLLRFFYEHSRLCLCTDKGFMLQGPEGAPGPQGPKGTQVRVVRATRIMTTGFKHLKSHIFLGLSWPFVCIIHTRECNSVCTGRSHWAVSHWSEDAVSHLYRQQILS